MVGKRQTGTNWAKGGVNWIEENPFPAQDEPSTGCPERLFNLHPWRFCKMRLDTALSNLLWPQELPLLWAGGWTTDVFRSLPVTSRSQIIDAHEWSQFTAFHQPKVYGMPRSSKRKPPPHPPPPPLPRAQTAVFREPSPTSALHPSTALPASGARLRAAKADGASRGAAVRSHPGHAARGPQPGATPHRLRSGSSPQAPPETFPGSRARSSCPPGHNALSPAPCRGDGEAGSLPPPPARRGSPAAEDSPRHRIAPPRRAAPCAGLGAAHPRPAGAPVPGLRYERRRGEGVSGPQGDPAAFRGRRGGGGEHFPPRREGAPRRYPAAGSGLKVAGRTERPEAAARVPCAGSRAAQGRVGAAGRGAAAGAPRCPPAVSLRGRAGIRAGAPLRGAADGLGCRPLAGWGGSELVCPRGRGAALPRGLSFRFVQLLSGLGERETHNCAVRYCVASSKLRAVMGDDYCSVRKASHRLCKTHTDA